MIDIKFGLNLINMTLSIAIKYNLLAIVGGEKDTKICGITVSLTLTFTHKQNCNPALLLKPAGDYHKQPLQVLDSIANYFITTQYKTDLLNAQGFLK